MSAKVYRTHRATDNGFFRYNLNIRALNEIEEDFKFSAGMSPMGTLHAAFLRFPSQNPTKDETTTFSPDSENGSSDRENRYHKHFTFVLVQ